MGDQEQLIQAVLNIVRNAAQACVGAARARRSASARSSCGRGPRAR